MESKITTYKVIVPPFDHDTCGRSYSTCFSEEKAEDSAKLAADYYGEAKIVKQTVTTTSTEEVIGRFYKEGLKHA